MDPQLFVRQNTALAVVADKSAVLRPPEDSGLRPEEKVDAWVARLIGRPLRPDRRQVLVDACPKLSGDNDVRALVNLIVSMPEYQLC